MKRNYEEKKKNVQYEFDNSFFCNKNENLLQVFGIIFPLKS